MSTMLLGYNTNGLAHHALEDAVEVIATVGYRSAAISIDHGPLSPRVDDLPASLARLRRLLDRRGLRCVVETGARFLLDPFRKHEPTLVSADPAGRMRRAEFYRHAIRCAAALNAGCVSLWSGVLHDEASDAAVWTRLCDGLNRVLDEAAAQHVVVAFEPEPGMWIDSTPRYVELCERLGRDDLRLTLDIGHLHCQGEPIVETIRRFAPQLVNVHLEDMRRGVHEHLMFGEGEIAFPPVFDALAEIGYAGGIHVELSRHGAEGPDAARRAFEFLSPLMQRTISRHG